MDCVRKRGKVYCAVITVPADLHLQVGKKQIWRSLKTKNYSVARSLARKLLLTVDQLFSQIRNTMDSRLINALVAEFGLDLLRYNDEYRQGTRVAPSHCNEEEVADIEFIKDVYTKASQTETGRFLLLELNAKRMVERIDEKIFANKPEDLHFVSDAYEYFVDKYGIDIPPPGSKDEKEILTALAQTARLVFKIEQERVQGIRDDSEFQHRLISKWQSDLPPEKDTGMPLSELLDQYYTEWDEDYRKKPNVNEYRINRKKRDLEIIKDSFIDFFGKDIGIKEIDDDKAKKWRDYFQTDNKLSNSSVNKYLEHLTAAFKWAANRQRKYVEFNPFENKRLTAGVKRERSREFSPEELQLYINLLADTYLPENPEYAWIPLIILYQGMRNNEIAQLYLDDIQERDGIVYFRICSTVDRNQRVKADASQRDLPIHSKMIELGFLEYVERMRREGHEQLFPNCSYNERTGRYYDDNLSARLNAIVDCVSDDIRLRVYSLRANFKTEIESRFTNTVIDAMVRKSNSMDLGGLERFVNRAFNDVMGHAFTKGGEGDLTYRKVRLQIMKRIVELAEHPVDISRLKRVLLQQD